jgi:septum formation protein
MARDGKNSRINGSFYTIMGLPTHLVYETLKELNL